MGNVGLNDSEYEENSSYSIENVQNTLEEEYEKVKVEVPSGLYVCQIKEPMWRNKQGNLYTDSSDHQKVLIPLEISEGEFNTEWLWEAVYVNNKDSDTGKMKDGMGKRKVARLANAVGLKTLNSLDELVGQFVKVDYGLNKRGYTEIKEVSSFSGNGVPIPPPSSKEATGEELPF